MSKTKENKNKSEKAVKTTQKNTENKMTIEEQINSVNTEIIDEEHGLEKIEEKIKEELEPVIEITDEIDSVISSKEVFEKETKDMTNADIINYAKQQLDKATKVKGKLLNIINSPKSKNVTGWWNGSGFGL